MCSYGWYQCTSQLGPVPFYIMTILGYQVNFQVWWHFFSAAVCTMLYTEPDTAMKPIIFQARKCPQWTPTHIILTGPWSFLNTPLILYDTYSFVRSFARWCWRAHFNSQAIASILNRTEVPPIPARSATRHGTYFLARWMICARIECQDDTNRAYYDLFMESNDPNSRYLHACQPGVYIDAYKHCTHRFQRVNFLTD